MSGHSNQVTKTFGALTVGGNTIKGGNTTSVAVTPSPAPVAYNSTASIAAADALAGLITSTSSAVTLTMPTGAALIAAMTKPAIGDTFNLTFVKTGANDITVAAGASGSTLVGSATVATATSGTYKIRVTGITTPAYSMYRI